MGNFFKKIAKVFAKVADNYDENPRVCLVGTNRATQGRWRRDAVTEDGTPS